VFENGSHFHTSLVFAGKSGAHQSGAPCAQGLKWLTLANIPAYYDTATMEQYTLKNVNNSMNTNIYSYLETSGGQSSNTYLNVVHFLNTRAD
jgi:hypothetical protein